MNINDMFTPAAQQAISIAHHEAMATSSPIESRHLLWGLYAVDGSRVAPLVTAAGCSDVQLRETLQLADDVTTGDILDAPMFSLEGKSVMEQALRYSMARSESLVDCEHIFLSLIHFDTFPAGQLLETMNIDDKTAEQTFQEQDTEPAESVQGPDGKQRKALPKIVKEWGRNLTEMAENDELDPVIGRDQEIERVIQIFGRRTKNNPVLVGEPGVGKTAIAEGLAQAIANGEVPDHLRGVQVIAVDLASMVAGTQYRGEFEKRLEKMIKTVSARTDMILFMDEIHQIVGLGNSSGAMDAGSILKPALARGELRILGATTLDEFRTSIEKDAALERRFQRVVVDEPSTENTFIILQALRERYEQHHQITITDEALRSAAELGSKHLPDRQQPDAAIDLMDEAAARANLLRLGMGKPKEQPSEEEAARLLKQQELQEQKEAAIEAEEFTLAGELHEQLQALTGEEKEQTPQATEQPSIGTEEIAEIIHQWTGIPVGQLTEAENKRLLDIEAVLGERVIGQKDAIHAIARTLRRRRVGLGDTSRPQGSFLFLGPTGVGKTELARTLAHFLFGDEDSMVRIDMSEYMEKHTISRLIGAPPGYIGYNEPGMLTEPVRRRPYSVVLLDEIEKAHPQVADILLQILEDGHLTDATGRKVDFTNTIIIMTSNVGAAAMVARKQIGFALVDESSQEQAVEAQALGALKSAFRPELLNRIDETLVFHSLDDEQLRVICDLLLSRTLSQLPEGTTVSLDESMYTVLLRDGTDRTMGARPLRRAITKWVEDPLADHLLGQTDISGDWMLSMTEIDGEERTQLLRQEQPVLTGVKG